ncbi:hypothetical protein LNTAR_03259 [Lentisphaera araneosa HTCC2155]|uniref:Lipoprotein n=1 Tax=Lentisphaera araneosa HTCC2155 TaxID=313628 RepID=A6DT39_9BACT|nr:hypothetical protein [Lentisphaera araneosa]EDM25214.1 hypothetical protein LNTAR_03259 [Lentisphaera araneosa HTCC2155]
MLKNQLIYLFSILFLAVGCSEKPATVKTSEENSKQAETQNDHGHSHTPHHGIEAKLYSDQQAAGIAELKLHDDKGDLELWLTNRDEAHSPLDLGLDTKITVKFISLEGKEVQLQVRNKDKNEDEDGMGNIRNSKTNYFIFPGDTKADSTFLIGKEFSAEVQISFNIGDKVYQSKKFQLKPHVH